MDSFGKDSFVTKTFQMILILNKPLRFARVYFCEKVFSEAVMLTIVPLNGFLVVVLFRLVVN